MANASPATENLSDNTKMNFGRFKVRLAELLTTEIILSLATFFMFTPAKIDKLRHEKNSPEQRMVSLMEEKGQIKPNDISPLLTALDKLELHGLRTTLHRIFQGSKDFGSFKVRLAELLTTEIILKLAMLFMFPPAEIDELRHEKKSPRLLMVTMMEERGQIQPNNISPLLTALDKLELHGLRTTLHRIFQGSEDKTCLFVRYLKTFYKQCYSKIHPIPYIREKVYCVNDVFVEGGIEMHGRQNTGSERPLEGKRMEAVKLKSYRDVFNDDIISSKRILLEGDPGYGKSTFTLQAAYDWCTASDSSPLKDVAIFILLPLRLLGGILSICQAIKLMLMPVESNLTEEDIMEILINSRCVVMILDGYDEFPDKDISNHIMKIIAGKMFANFKVITCTRSAYLPVNLDTETVNVRLTGFDDNARDEYIRRAVAVNDNQAARRINDLLTRSPVLSDICQVPLFCVMFVHISYEEESVVSFVSVTSFFSHILTCFYAHMRIKTGYARKPNDHSIIPAYPKLNKLLFDALTGKNQQIVWQKDEFKNNVGDVCYNELITIGILVEDDILKIYYKPGMAAVPFLQRTTVVRFYHKLFAEWYAANYLSKCAGSTLPLLLRNKFKKINPVDLQFVFRFACGLNEKASSRIIKYLKGMEDGQSFSILCFFEQVGKPDDVVAIVEDLLTGGATIRSTDSRLLQRSTIQILDIAAKSDIPITSVCLNKCFKEFKEDVIVLHSGLRLNQLLTVEKIHIETEQVNEEPRILTEEDVRKMLRSKHLKELSFAGCTLPLTFSLESLPIDMRSRNIKVCWSLLDREVQLNVESGEWELKDKESLPQLCSGKVVIEDRDHYLQQCLTIISVQTASYHDIPITSVCLNKSFKECEEDVIVLHSGLKLNKLLTVEKIHIETEQVNEEPRIITEEDVTMMLRYGLRSEHLNELSFAGCTLPLSFSSESLPRDMRSRNIKVCWSLLDREVQLNVQSGEWELKDKESLPQLCSGKVVIEDRDHYLQQCLTIISVQTASYHDIPITSVCLNKSFKECEEDVIVLYSGLKLNQLLTVEEIHIKTKRVNGEPRILTEEEVTKMLRYGLRSEHFKELSFAGCTLPLTFSLESLPIDMRSRNIKVCWSLLDREVQLNVQSGEWELEDKESLCQLCSKAVVISDRDHYLQQCLTIISVQTASYHEIPISCVRLLDCSPRVDESGLNIILQSGLSLSILSSLQKLEIYDDCRKLTNEELAAIFSYSSQCTSLKELKFGVYVLPDTIPVGIIPSSLETRNVKVWNEDIYSNSSSRLNLHTGRWQACDDDGNLPEEEECEKDVIVLHSGLRLHRWLTAEKIHIETEQVNGEPRILTEEDVMEMLSYGLRSEHLKELSFAGCMLPLSFSSESLPRDMRSRDIKVCWSLLDSEVLLNVQSGQWELKDKESLRQLCSGKVVIEENDHYFKQCLTIISVQTASYHDIPISCVELFRCSPRVDESGLNLILQSGLSLSILSSLQKLWIYDDYRRLTNEELAAILSYSSQCTSLKQLKFWFYDLPDTIPVGSIPSSLKPRNVKVWNEGIYSSSSRRLNLQTGRWQACDYYGNLPGEEECEKDVIVLHSGLRLHRWLTAEKIHIEIEQVNGEPRILTEEHVMEMLSYGLRSEHLKELSFAGCTLPLSFSSESLPIDMRSRDIKVCWSLFDSEVLLNVQSGQWELEDRESLHQLCSVMVVIEDRDHYLQQCLTIISVQTASYHNIPISCVDLVGCSPRVDESGLNLILQSGLSLSILSSLQKLMITDIDRRLTNEELAAILSYSSQCTSLKELEFWFYDLPDTIPVGSIPSSLKPRNVKVWNEGIYSSSSRRLNLQTGRWQQCDDDGNLPEEEECEKDVIVLHSGLRLHRWLTAEKMHIETEQVNGEPRILTEEDVMEMLSYGLRSEHLKELSFAGCTLPLTFSSESLPIDMRSRDIKVCWSLLDREVLLNVQSDQWEVKDKESLRQLCSGKVVIEDMDHYLQQCLTIISVQTASYHKIPISCVYLGSCSPRVDESGLNLILQSGLSLSILSSLQKLVIFDDHRTLTNEELAAILSYSSQCTSLKELKVSWYNLPDTIPVGFIPSSLKSRDVKVWNFRIPDRRLNLQTGLWQACDYYGILPGEEGFDEISY